MEACGRCIELVPESGDDPSKWQTELSRPLK